MEPRRQYETEAEFLSAIREYGRLRGWVIFHHLYSKGTEAGFPDLMLLRAEPRLRLVFAEVKGLKGKLTDAQAYTLEHLRLVAGEEDDDADDDGIHMCLNPELRLSLRIRPAFEVYCWWPEDWELIESVLA